MQFDQGTEYRPLVEGTLIYILTLFNLHAFFQGCEGGEMSSGSNVRNGTGTTAKSSSNSGAKQAS